MKYLEKNKDITQLSNFRTPAVAEYFFELQEEREIDTLYKIIKWAKRENLPILFVSGGTNMFFAFEKYHGLVIQNSLKGWKYDKKMKILESYGAENISQIAEVLEKNHNQSLWHRFIGLPGSIAGAIYGNAGCFWLEIENNFIECKILDIESGQVSTFTKEDMEFEYRNSRIKKEKKYFIISASFDLSKKREKYHSDVDNIDFRENKQPKGKSCGSFFKNPSREQSAGYLIEQVGLKWYKLGWAYFSEQHANFLMHDGTGTYQDILNLIKLAQKKVEKEFCVKLENEVQIITNYK